MLRQAQPERLWIRFSIPTIAALSLVAGCREAPAEPQRALSFPALTGRVVDQADLLTAAQEADLTHKSEALERDVGPQYVIATVRTLDGKLIEEYGVQLGRHWGVGHNDRYDGVLLIVAPHERKARIEVGYGLENRVTDPFAQRVLDEDAVPHFSRGNFPKGIDAASDAIIERLRSPASGQEIARQDRITA